MENKTVDCCGFAGDKGFFEPQVNKNALKGMKSLLPSEISRGYSQSLPCEIGLSLHSGRSFRPIFELVDECSIPITKRR